MINRVKDHISPTRTEGLSPPPRPRPRGVEVIATVIAYIFGWGFLLLFLAGLIGLNVWAWTKIFRMF